MLAGCYPGYVDLDTDYALLADAYGAVGFKVKSRAEFIPALQEAIALGRPAVIDLPVTREPRIRASGYWDANTYLKPGWNRQE